VVQDELVNHAQEKPATQASTACGQYERQACSRDRRKQYLGSILVMETVVAAPKFQGVHRDQYLRHD
jgi:hypothetical protein